MFVKNSENFFERNLMRIGIGLALFGLLGVFLNLIRIPADWKIILILSAIGPAYYLFKNYKKFNFKLKITRTNLCILGMLVIFAINFYVYASGSFVYPFLENDDPWSHAGGVKYVTMEKNVFGEDAKNVRYVNPYPPTYDLILGVVHQLTDSLSWTLKFFNALIISFSTIFFFFLVREWTKNNYKALFAAFFLFSIPAFMSHFIWALSLTVPLFFVSFYCVERIQYDKKWWIIAGLVMFTALTSSPTHSTYFGLFFVFYFLTRTLLERKILIWPAAAGILGLSLSFLLWWFPMLLRYGFEQTMKGIGFKLNYVGEHSLATALTGTGDRLYTFMDFFVAQKQNMINNPIGVGVVLSLLVAVALIFTFINFKQLLKKENHWLAITIVLFLFTLYAVNASRFPIRLSPFRSWMLFAIPVCILAAQGTFYLYTLAKKSTGKVGAIVLVLVIISGVYFTSTQQKIAVNTANWPPGGFWSSGEEIGAYVWMKDNLPKDSKVFTFTNDDQILGFDMFSCRWCSDIKEYKKIGFNQTVDENYAWMKQNNYEYAIIDGRTARDEGPEVTNQKIQDFGNSGKFSPVFQNNGAVIFRIA